MEEFWVVGWGINYDGKKEEISMERLRDDDDINQHEVSPLAPSPEFYLSKWKSLFFMFQSNVQHAIIVEEKFDAHLGKSMDSPYIATIEKDPQALDFNERWFFFMFDRHSPQCTIDDDSQEKEVRDEAQRPSLKEGLTSPPEDMGMWFFPKYDDIIP